MTTRRVVGLLLAVTLVATDAAAQVYRWVDEWGAVHYAGSRDEVPEQYRSQLPADQSPWQPTPDVSSRRPPPIPGECILLIPGLRRPRESRSYPNCDECRQAVDGLGADKAARASCIPVGQ